MKSPLDLFHDLKLKTLVKVAFIAGVFSLLAAAMAGGLAGRYELVPIGFGATKTHHPIAYRLDKWMGKTWLIRGLDAYEVKNSPLASPSDPGSEW